MEKHEIWHAGNQPYLTGLVPSSNIQDPLTARVLIASPAFTGNATIVGKITAGYTASYARVNGVDECHTLLLKGDSTAFGPNYAITAGDITTFIEAGGIWKFRKISATSNTSIVEISETDLIQRISIITLPSSSSRLSADLIYDGSVTNVEFNYLDGLTGTIKIILI